MELFRVVLPVGDVDRAARFYEGLLGVPGRRIAPQRHYIHCGAVILALVDPRGPGRPADVRPNPDHVYFSTPDLAAARARAAVALETGEPGEIGVQPWGERSFYLADPWGNPLCVVEAGTEFRAVD